MKKRDIHFTITDDEKPGLVITWHQERGYCGAKDENFLCVTQAVNLVNCLECKSKIKGFK